MLFPRLTKTILSNILDAKKEGKPISPEEARKRWDGCTWRELLDGGYVIKTPTEVLVSERGMTWLESHKNTK